MKERTKGLSSAINDPTTSTEVVLRLGSILRSLLTADVPALSVAGPQHRVLLRPWVLSHKESIEHAFDQIRAQADPHADGHHADRSRYSPCRFAAARDRCAGYERSGRTSSTGTTFTAQR
ncbi:DUF2254 domain-containing protein [Rhodococcus sp. FXJ9.536]|uniref:DUF2254 domain-containing protein n=1 Tax=Rhodococcus tibetensis TaxID=2965064 RepID=A0ABT1QGZ5_9NOCA|nr:DUF2254 domain-containing protein [Rhodococcus sp. FXJ9.536]